MWQEFVSPFLVVELLSPGTEAEDLGSKVRELGKPPTKWEVYERILRVPFYVVFDSPSETLHDRYENQLRVFGLANGRYQAIDVSGPEPRVWFDELELGLGVWQGAYQGIEGKWLRWYEASGDWIPTEVEGRQLAETQAETERSARELAETQAETERSARHLAETQAETERSARQRAEMQAETERSARRSAIPRLASLGLTVEQIAESLGLSIAEVQAQIYS